MSIRERWRNPLLKRKTADGHARAVYANFPPPPHLTRELRTTAIWAGGLAEIEFHLVRRMFAPIPVTFFKRVVNSFL